MAEEKRKVILHYHLFKNAGTSLDAAFKENFSEEKGEWVTKEFPANPAQNQRQLRQWILDNPQAKCFSSHTALLPVPEFDDIEVLPVIFVRHPIDRIASAYSFEKKQGADTFGSVLARNTDLKGYIETRLSLPHDRQCRNFHANRLASNFRHLTNEESASIKALEVLPFVGLVEKFDRSLQMLSEAMIEFGLEVLTFRALKQNVSQDGKLSIAEKLDELKAKLGVQFFEEISKQNQIDLEIYTRVKQKYGED